MKRKKREREKARRERKGKLARADVNRITLQLYPPLFPEEKEQVVRRGRKSTKREKGTKERERERESKRIEQEREGEKEEAAGSSKSDE